MRKEVYAIYAQSGDMTFIMRDTYDGEQLRATECIGWYFGEPNDEATLQFSGKLKAEF